MSEASVAYASFRRESTRIKCGDYPHLKIHRIINPEGRAMSKALLAAFSLAMILAGCGAESHTPAAPAAATSTDPAAPLSPEAEAEKERIRKQNAAAEAALSGH